LVGGGPANANLWRIAVPNICPAQRVKQGANCQISTAGETPAWCRRAGENNVEIAMKLANSPFQDKRIVDKRGSAKGVVDIATERSIRSGVQSFTALEEAIARKKAD
jgi:hypothetical protein